MSAPATPRANDLHRILLVEDDDAVALALEDLVASLGARPRRAATLADVREAIEDGGYCGVLLDLQIPSEAGGRPLVGAGETALALLRQRHPHRNAEGRHVMPVVAVTGYSVAPDFIARLFRAGIDDFIPKSFDDGTKRSFNERMDGMIERIRVCLVESGRADHARCEALSHGAGGADAARARLVLTSEKIDRRLVVGANGRRVELQATLFVVLLKLALEHRRDPSAWHTHHDLGIGRTPSVPTRLREALAGSAPGLAVIETRYGGYCRLAPSVVVEMDVPALARHDDDRVRKLAARHAGTARR